MSRWLNASLFVPALLLLSACGSTQKVVLKPELVRVCPDPVFYDQPIRPDLTDDMTLEEIIVALTTALAQANRDRMQVSGYCSLHSHEGEGD